MWEIGAIVRLKSGGPKMTVKSEDVNQNVVCTWFSGDDVKEATFQRDQLQEAKEQ